MTVAWRLYASNWAVFSGAVVILFLSWVVLEVAVVITHSLGILPWAILHLAFLLVFAGLVAGLHRLALTAVDGGQPRIADLFGAMERGPALLVASVAYIAMVGVGVILLIVPGLYLAARFCLIGQVAAERRLSPAAVLREAARMTRGRWPRAAGTVALLVVLIVAGAALLGVGLLVALPLSVLTATGFYRSISAAEVSRASTP